ncbi:hypothetical protein MMC20_003686 [Loxospora ochrophaea]|nr:hypothetical protein [Loxospora ochrophaea]
MPPRLQCLCSRRTHILLARPQALLSPNNPLCVRLSPRRTITADEKPLPQADTPGPGPNQEQLPHVSEEAATTGKITGEGGPEIDQGTPIQEIIQRDEDSKENAPQVIQDDINSSKSSPAGSRSFSTSARHRQEEAMISYEDEGIEPVGHKFGLPELPGQKTDHFRHRYDPVIHQVTNLLMRSGKLSVAQRNMSMILNHLRTASPPTVNPTRPLLPGAPPPSHLPLNPVLYLTLAIDSVAPLFRLRSQKGIAGGGVTLKIPVPLNVRQRRRQALDWILEAASKKRTVGSGRGSFARKVAQELIAVVEGKSVAWERRGGVHKLGVAARENLSTRRRRR